MREVGGLNMNPAWEISELECSEGIVRLKEKLGMSIKDFDAVLGSTKLEKEGKYESEFKNSDFIKLSAHTKTSSSESSKEKPDDSVVQVYNIENHVDGQWSTVALGNGSFNYNVNYPIDEIMDLCKTLQEKDKEIYELKLKLKDKEIEELKRKLEILTSGK